jgi:hypothetical protein
MLQNSNKSFWFVFFSFSATGGWVRTFKLRIRRWLFCQLQFYCYPTNKCCCTSFSYQSITINRAFTIDPMLQNFLGTSVQKSTLFVTSWYFWESLIFVSKQYCSTLLDLPSHIGLLWFHALYLFCSEFYCDINKTFTTLAQYSGR